MSLTYGVRCIDNPPPITPPPVSYSSLRIVFASTTLCFIRASVLLFPPSVCLKFISLLSPPGPSLTEREIININAPPPVFPLPLFLIFLLLLISFLLHYLYLSLGLYPSSLLSLNLPSICLHLSPLARLSAAVQYSSITVVLIIPFSACSHTVIYQINNPPLLRLLRPTSSPLSWRRVRMLAMSDGFACQSPIITTIIINNRIWIAGCPY